MKRDRACAMGLAVGFLFGGTTLPAVTIAMAQDESTEKSRDQPDVEITVPEVIVSGERSQAYWPQSRTEVTANPATLPAPTTILDSKYIQQSPYTGTYGDLLRQLPGVDVNNFGQGGLGYGISIRGFTDIEHGRDVAYFIDGVPVNEVSSVQTPNYADLNILIPETVERLEITRGPFNPLYGDANLGGSVNIITKRFDNKGSVGAYGGYFNTVRGVVTYARPRTEGTIAPFLVFEGYNSDGYRDNQNYKRYNLFGKFTIPSRYGDLSVRTQFYGGDWGSPGYISRSLVQSGVLSPKAPVNGTDGGKKDFQNVVANYALGESDQALTFTGFLNHDTFSRFADFGSGQSLAQENRVTTGLTLRKVWTGKVFMLPAQFMVGTNFRNDSVGVIRVPTIARNPSGPNTTDVNYTEIGWGQYMQAQIKPLSWLKLTGGGRYDHFWYDIDDHLASSSVPKSDTGVLSPKGGIAITPVSWLEFYANYGEGFRSPSAIDEVISSPNLKPLKLLSQEVGVQVQYSKFRFQADVYTTTLEREIFQPAPGLPLQNLGRSRREGYELEGRYYIRQDPQGRASLFANFTQIRAVLLNRAPSEFVPNVPAYIFNIGSDFDVPIGGRETPHRVFGLAYGTYYGKKHLTEDGVITSSPYPRISGRLGYAHQKSGWMVYADVIWYPGDRLSETAINLGPGVGASPSDIVVNPQAPFQFMVGVTYRFPTGTQRAGAVEERQSEDIRPPAGMR
ncbi:MAG: TonB-dependent receptor [Nitrospira sp.]|nr:TonB-dependent receptor [Nitrospira sp.]